MLEIFSLWDFQQLLILCAVANTIHRELIWALTATIIEYDPLKDKGDMLPRTQGPKLDRAYKQSPSVPRFSQEKNNSPYSSNMPSFVGFNPFFYLMIHQAPWLYPKKHPYVTANHPSSPKPSWTVPMLVNHSYCTIYPSSDPSSTSALTTWSSDH